MCEPMKFHETNLLVLIHYDIADLKSTITRGGNKFYIIFIDDFSRYWYVYLLRTKDEAEEKFKIYKAKVENKLNNKIKRLRYEKKGEYDESISLSNFCEWYGIIHEVTSPCSLESNGIVERCSLESNGVVERKNRTLTKMMNAMLIGVGAPPNLWEGAILSAIYTK